MEHARWERGISVAELAVDSHAACKLGNAGAAVGARLLQPHHDAAFVVDHSAFSGRRAIALLLPAWWRCAHLMNCGVRR
ncbi:MAG TPA: hypothetical protein IAB86_07190 [Candidatus Aphodovivens avicola]|nr:hypothetical protein [Candidatus Aphodovivens avicola]